MKRLVFIIAFVLSAIADVHAWNIAGSNQAEIWISQPGYSLSYKEMLDLNLKGSLDNGIDIKAGIRYQQDEEVWNDSTISKGVSKKFIDLQKDGIKLRLGNYYTALGRGLIINCVNDNQVKLDREIEGGLFGGNYGEMLEMRVLAGQVFENAVRIDSSSYYGGETRLFLWDKLDIGGTYLRANASGRPKDINFNKPAEESFGGNIGARIASLELYGEYVMRHTYGMFDPTLGWIGAEDVDGKGFYSSIGWAASGIGVVVDYKDYRDMDSKVNAPPTCNREGRLLNQGADEQGLQIDITVSPLEYLELHGNYSAAEADNYGAGWEDTYFESEWEISPRWTLIAEARARTEDSLEAEVLRRKYKGGGLEAKWLYADQKALSLKIDGNKYNNLYISGPLKYNEIHAEFSLVPFGFINFYGQVEVSDKRLPEYENQKSWGRGGAAINVGQDHKLDVSFGQNKGGLVCSGGYCRYEPPFKGFKAVWLWSF
jgi:hypothetical protein